MTASFITRAEVGIQFATVAALNSEISARVSLASNLASEVARATVAEGTLTTATTTLLVNLNAEISTRNTLSTSLTAEISRAILAEGTLTTNLAASIATLTANLNNEINTRYLADGVLTANLASEVTRATAVEGTLTANLSTENFARITLGISLASETSRATAVEDILTTNVDILTTNLATVTASVAVPTSTQGIEYWIDLLIYATGETVGFTYIAANLGKVTIKILGIGFQTYYNPQFQDSFNCVFSNPQFGSKTTTGVVVYDIVNSNLSTSFIFYHVECIVPVIANALLVNISLYKSTGLLYAYNGFPGGNVLTVQYYWAVAVQRRILGDILVNGIGFNTIGNTTYRCRFTGKTANNTAYNTSNSNLSATNLTSLNCGIGSYDVY